MRVQDIKRHVHCMRTACALHVQDIKLPDKYVLLPVPKGDAAHAQPDDIVQLSRTAKARSKDDLSTRRAASRALPASPRAYPASPRAPLCKLTCPTLQLHWPPCMPTCHQAPQISLKDDLLTATGYKGYRMVRATHGVSSGSWYFEIKVNTPLNGEDGHTRLGWCTEMGELQAPVGYDQNSYAYRDRVALPSGGMAATGSRFHESTGAEYGGPYGPGDVIGCWLKMGAPAALVRSRQRINIKGVEYIVQEERERTPSVGIADTLHTVPPPPAPPDHPKATTGQPQANHRPTIGQPQANHRPTTGQPQATCTCTCACTCTSHVRGHVHAAGVGGHLLPNAGQSDTRPSARVGALVTPARLPLSRAALRALQALTSPSSKTESRKGPRITTSGPKSTTRPPLSSRQPLSRSTLDRTSLSRRAAATRAQ